MWKRSFLSAVLSRVRRSSAGCGLLLFPLLLSPSSSGAILVLKNGRTFRGDVTRHDPKNFLLPGGKVFVPAEDAAWFSKSTDVDQVIREWSEDIRGRPDYEDALLPLARFCLQEGRLERGTAFAREWARFRRWKAYLSREFLILTAMKEGKAKKIGARMDAALALLRKEFPGSEKGRYTCVVRLFRDLDEFQRAAQSLPYKPETSYYYPKERTVYLVSSKADSPQWTYWDAYRVLCYHFLIDRYLGFNPKYTWILVGTAACFENARYRSGKLHGAWRKHRENADRIRAALRGKTYVPLEKFLRMKADDFAMGDPYGIHVAQAWSLVYFFHKSRKRRYKDAFFRYLDVLKKTGDDERALEKVLLPLGLKKLERDWMAFYGLR